MDEPMKTRCGWCITGHHEGCRGRIQRHQGNARTYPCPCPECPETRPADPH